MNIFRINIWLLIATLLSPSMISVTGNADARSSILSQQKMSARDINPAIAIGTPSSIGSVANANANTSSITVTTSAAILAGRLVVVVITVPSSPLRTVSSVSDGTNAYTLAAAINNGPYYNLEVWYKENAAAVSSGASLSATLSGATNGSNGYGAAAFQISGILVSGALDKTATQYATTSTPSATTATLSKANEIVIGASYTPEGSRTFTEASGYNNLSNFVGGALSRIGIGYKIVAATTAVTYNPTLSGSNENLLVVGTWKGN